MSGVTFAIVGDVHVGSVSSEFRTAIELCNARATDFVVLLGDLVTRATEENVDEFIRDVRTLLKPYYLVFGNHDARGQLEGSDVKGALGKALPGPWRESFTYCFESGDWLFVVAVAEMSQSPYKGAYINNYKGYVNRAGQIIHLRGDDLERFQSLLDASGDRPTCVFIHVPVIPIAERLHSRGFWDQTRVLEELQVRSLIQARENVKAVFSGHQHFNQVGVFNGQLHCVTQNIVGRVSLGGTPAIRLVELSETEIRSTLFWADSDGEPPGEIGTEAGDRSFVWEFETRMDPRESRKGQTCSGHKICPDP